jgi:hypothetical protein
MAHAGPVTEYRDYENGVADVLSFLARDTASVERNVRLPGRRSGKPRQIDVVVRGRLFASIDATMIVECKCWATRIDVKDLESFLGMVADVGADIGLMMTTKGATNGAHERARQEGGVRLKMMSLDELKAWSPPGTVTARYQVPARRQADAEKALRSAGFRVAPDTRRSATDDDVVLDVFRHYGARHPGGEVQQEHLDRSQAALKRISIEPIPVGSGLTFAGGTPGHRWLQVVVNGTAADLKVLAATEVEAEQQLDQLAILWPEAGVPRGALSVIKPDGWPVIGIFGSTPSPM